MYLEFIFIILCVSTVYTKNDIDENNNNRIELSTSEESVGCICGVFLSGQFKKGTKEQPTGNPALLHEQSELFPCTPLGNKQCINKCLEMIIKHLPNSSDLLCAAIDRNCLKERAYLFIQNCENKWINTNLSTGKKYCCKDGISYKCPIG
ncbi:follicle cell protein 3C-1 [Vespa velutina]|uniref:follicle cell protein 3C-1 n=1 Tax=Vespa velutina TaxID=202808 RepID=UPI001FB2648C|nr:follicle cell protein 3C-1 [Vespa velutina]